MSSHMMIATISSRTTDPDQLDWDAAKAALDAVEDVEAFQEDNVEADTIGYDVWGADDRNDAMYDDAGQLVLSAAKELGAALLDRLHEALLGSDVELLLGQDQILFASGGLSSGDLPCDGAMLIHHSYWLPEAVLLAAGLDWPTTAERVDALKEAHGGAARGEHPEHTIAQWRLDVADEATRLGYWEWVLDSVEHPEIDDDEY